MSKNYTIERVGQLEFFDKFGISDIELANYTDGVYRGTIFEFKKSISNINAVLFQAIKYLSHMRVKGASIPANILLVSLNEEVAYLFKSKDYLEEIEEIYAGAASKNNLDFAARTRHEKIPYSSEKGSSRIREILDEISFIKIHIDVFCVVGWSERFYQEKPTASKIELFQELRSPAHFSELIYPWKGDETDFQYIMDLLNDKKHKKELGAFYTPPAYCRKATEMVRNAIRQIPEDNDYIILDRCAGTGNLQEFLTDKDVKDITIGELSKYLVQETIDKYLRDKQNVISMLHAPDFDSITMAQLEEHTTKLSIYDYLFDNELGRTIVNTYELKEWIVLNERIGDRVKLIIPPPQEINNSESLVAGGDALSSQFVKAQGSLNLTEEYSSSINMLIDYVNDPKTNIILYENPPYSDVGAAQNNPATASKKTAWKSSYVSEQMKLWLAENKSVSSRASNDLANLFLWSAFKYYLLKPDDSYIAFSPPKYIKSQHLLSKVLAEGYIFNRAYFHANSPSAISCIRWINQGNPVDNYDLEILDIENDKDVKSLGPINIKKVYKNLSAFYDKYDPQQHPDDQPGVTLDWSGYESEKHYSRVNPIYNDNLVGYLVVQDFGFEHPRLATNLLRAAPYAGNGFFLRTDNFLKKLPLFAAGKYDFGSRWWENGTVFKCADGGDRYSKDEELLKSSLIYTCLSYFNKCRSFDGSDGRHYRNELCFDGDTLASRTLRNYKLTETENQLMKAFGRVLKEAKTTENYSENIAYGVYQIAKELNTFKRDETTNDKIFDCPPLNTELINLRVQLGKYYEAAIQPKLFEYELLK